MRAKKFGAQSENLKKDLRAQRFGTPATASVGGNGKTDDSALAKRAQRFGTVPNTPTSGVDKELLDKRAKRFGIEAQESNGSNKSKVFDIIRY